MFMASQLLGFMAAVAAAALSRAWGSGLNSASGASPMTASGLTFGTAAADRMVVACIKLDGASGPATAVTIGGVSATEIVACNQSDQYLSIWAAMVPTGTSGDVVVTFSGSAGRSVVSTYAVYGRSNVTAHATVTDVASPFSQNLAVPAGGVAIGALENSAMASATWTGLTEDYDNTVSTGRGMSTASAASAAASTITVAATPSGGTAIMAAASWGP
jgi:hypothetical protein